MKFVETHSYTVALMLEGVRDFPGQNGCGVLRPRISRRKPNSAWIGCRKCGTTIRKLSTTRWALPPVAMPTSATTTSGACRRWTTPIRIASLRYEFICNRPVLLNTAGGAGASISPNLAGRLAADFAECYQIFKASNPTYADQCLLSAEHIFDLANTAPGTLLTAGPFDFYPETEWRDDLELGATELYFALQPGNLPSGLPHTDPVFYLTAAANWAHAYITGPNDAADSLNLYDVTGLAHLELYRAFTIAGNPTGLAVTQASLLADLKKQLDKAVTQGNTDPFGFGFPWATYDTTSHGFGLVVMAAEYDNLTAGTAYAPYASRWLANVLGTNAWGTSLIVGDGDTFPLCMQHQVTNLIPSPPNGPPFLKGCTAVEGPNSFAAKGALTNMVACPPNGVDQFAQFNGNGAVYKDNVQSYSTVRTCHRSDGYVVSSILMGHRGRSLPAHRKGPAKSCPQFNIQRMNAKLGRRLCFRRILLLLYSRMDDELSDSRPNPNASLWSLALLHRRLRLALGTQRMTTFDTDNHSADRSWERSTLGQPRHPEFRVNPVDLMNLTTNSTTTNGIPIGMNTAVVELLSKQRRARNVFHRRHPLRKKLGQGAFFESHSARH